MKIFILIWLGQLISLIGSGLTAFALDVWVYQTTGSIFQFTLLTLFTTLPFVIISPIAGVLVDRWSRRWTMIISDTCSALSTLSIALLFASHHIEIWHIYLANAVSSCFSAFQWPAYTAATTLLVPKEDLNRASGLTQFGKSITQLIAPGLGGVLLGVIHVEGVILIDFATLFFALIPLLLFRLPEINTATKEDSFSSIFEEMNYGWRFLTDKPGLLGVLILFTAYSFLSGMTNILIIPLVLSFTSTVGLGIILTICGSGMLIGSLAISAWGQLLPSISIFLGSMLLCGLFTMMAGLCPSASLFTSFEFLVFFSIPFIRTSEQVIFQKKVAPDMQGRVFAFIATLSGASLPFAYLVAGPMADRVFEPLMAVDGPLAGSLGHIIGTGQGRGIGLLYIVMGILLILATGVGYLYPRLRLVEDELPDVISDEVTTTSDDALSDEALATSN